MAEYSINGALISEMSMIHKIIRNASSNWLSLAFSLLVGFVLSPYVVHHLGSLTYGLWSLVISLVGYMSLLDLGLRGAVTRFVARHHAQGEHLEASRAVSAALWMRVWLGLGIVITSVLISAVAGRLFHIPPELSLSIRLTLIIAGTTLALNLTLGIFGGVLTALSRFDLTSAVTIAHTLVRALGAFLVLRSGHGIVALALWELSAAALSNGVLVIICFRIYRELRIFIQRPDADVFKAIWQYSSFVFLINIFYQAIYYSDNLVVGVFVSAAAVTFYTIGGTLIEYLRQLISGLASTFLPLASGFEAQGENGSLRNLLIQGTRLTLFLALPIELALFFRGSTFISLWMGKQYAEVSGKVLQILLVGQFFSVASATSGNIAYGIAKHRPVTAWIGMEAVTNVLLSVYLVRHIGIYGVAWGTVIPTLVVHILFWPRYICKVLGLPLSSYYWQSWIRTGIAAIPYGLACYLTDRFWVANSLISFFLQIATILPLCLLGYLVGFWKQISVLVITGKTSSFTSSALMMPRRQELKK